MSEAQVLVNRIENNLNSIPSNQEQNIQSNEQRSNRRHYSNNRNYNNNHNRINRNANYYQNNYNENYYTNQNNQYNNQNSYYSNQDIQNYNNNYQSNNQNSYYSNQDNQNHNNNYQNNNQNRRFNNQNRNNRNNQNNQRQNDYYDNAFQNNQTNQRINSSSSSSSKAKNSKPIKENKANKDLSQNQNQNQKRKDKSNLTRTEILIDQLKKNKLECMVCYTVIKNDKSIWNCNVCFHIFHLNCIKKWANSPAAKVEESSDKWRCPGCQTTFNTIPNKYTCFCTKKLNPEHENRPYYQLKQLPHSCGEVCGKQLSLFNSQQNSDSLSQSLECKHKCLQICHPGPCSPCESLVTRTCNCGKAKFQVKCSSNKVPACDKKCDKFLNCKLHVCDRVCHSGECEPCSVDVELTCYSHLSKKLVKCGSEELNKSNNLFFSCDLECDKLLNCKNHKCLNKCHNGDCMPCQLLPSKLINCPCGQTQVKELLIKQKLIRTLCTDPVPTCDKKCSKILPCNSTLELNHEVHVCEQTCHTNECPPCEKLVKVKCRCGKDTEMVKCSERNQIKLCNRRCQKKKTCSRHQCNEICCDDKDHICLQICNKLLSCGLHKCEELCHKGSCKRCLIASFEERICECGSTIQYPPIRCGTKPLDCPNPCTRQHNCSHPITHSCHWEEKCPPCSFLTSKMCMGNHELRHNIPCYMKDVSCGKQCGRPMPNCSHKCNKTCHKDICLDDNEKCTQLCQKERPHCNHACNSLCHGDNPCPDSICQEIIIAKCKCGLKSKQVKCQTKMYAESAVVFENLASQLKEMLSCKSIDVSTFKSQETLKKKHELDCDEECLLAERNRNLAEVLKSEANSKPKPIYTDFLKSYARDDLQFAMNVEHKFEALINECRLFKNKKSLNLPIMKSNERRFIHELATYYAIETLSHDPEPFRNVTLYASKDKSYLPSQKLTQSIEIKKPQTMPKLAIKELNQRASNNPIQSNLKVLQPEVEMIPVSSAFSALKDEQDEQEVKKSLNDKVIDYFDLTD